MRTERGVVLINALVVVLVISSVAAALLTRSEAARIRAGTAQGAGQLAFHLDAIEDLALLLLADAGKDGGLVHSGQDWAARRHLFSIGNGRVHADIEDMQGKMNVNWLGAENDFADEAFRQLFAELDLPHALLEDIRDFLRPGGPLALPAYLRQTPPIQPRGGSVVLMDELRAVRGMDAAAFDTLSRHVTALPFDAKVNLNTASLPVLRAMLHPFPPEVRTEFARAGREDPVAHLRELRDMVIEITQSEDMGGLPLDRLTVTSQWFTATLAAELDGQAAGRRVILHRDTLQDDTLQVRFRWGLPD